MLTYRFGVHTGLAKQEGLKELSHVLAWSSVNNYQSSLRAIRRYFSIADQKQIIQQNQYSAQPWM